MHLGNLTVSNKFLFAGDEGTLAYKHLTLAYKHLPDIVQQVPSVYTGASADDPMTQSVYAPQSDGRL